MEKGGGGGCNFSISYNALTFRLVIFYGLEPYPYVAKGSYVSLYDTPSLMNKTKRNREKLKEKSDRDR